MKDEIKAFTNLSEEDQKEIRNKFRLQSIIFSFIVVLLGLCCLPLTAVWNDPEKAESLGYILGFSWFIWGVLGSLTGGLVSKWVFNKRTSMGIIPPKKQAILIGIACGLIVSVIARLLAELIYYK